MKLNFLNVHDSGFGPRKQMRQQHSVARAHEAVSVMTAKKAETVEVFKLLCDLERSMVNKLDKSTPPFFWWGDGGGVDGGEQTSL